MSHLAPAAVKRPVIRDRCSGAGPQTVVALTTGDDAVRSSIVFCSANPVAPTSGDLLQTLVVLFVALAIGAVLVTFVLLRSSKRRPQLTTGPAAPADEGNAPIASERR